MTVYIKGVRETPAAADGRRVLVDRLWPRGLTTEAVAHDDWLPQLGASRELRRWYGRDATRYEEFEHRYRQELEHSGALADLAEIVAEHPTVTLLVDSRDVAHSKAAVLRDLVAPAGGAPR